jgi:hypothetical protein
VIPFFCRHSRISAKRAGLRLAPVLVPVEETPVEDVPEVLPVAAALALEEVVLDDPPHAANPIQASSNMIEKAAATGVRRLV